MDYIVERFRLTETEWAKLDELFGDLAHYQAWQLLKKNVKNNHTHDVEDIAQELRFSIIRAGCYYKRQVYLEECLATAKLYVTDPVVLQLVTRLDKLWQERTRHGANRQRFGEHQEQLLEKVIEEHVPERMRPSKDRPLQIDNKFTTYCKAITWNCQKSLGKKITREKSLRSGMVSLSEYDYLVSTNGVISCNN